MNRELLQQALDALEKLSKLGNGDHDGNSEGNVIAQEARNKLRAHLAKPEPEPVAWINARGDYCEVIRKDTVLGTHTLPLYRREDV